MDKIIPDMKPFSENAEKIIMNYENGNSRIVYCIDEEINIPTGTIIIVRVNKYGNITSANKRFIELSNYSSKELDGFPIQIIHHPDMPNRIFSELWATIVNNDEWSGYMKFLRKDGRYIWAYITAVPMVVGGEFTGFVMTGRKASAEMISKYAAIYTGEKVRELNSLADEDKKDIFSFLKKDLF